MKTPLRGAIIGFGKVAELAHLPAWREVDWAGIVAVVDPVPAHRARAAALLPDARCYEQVETLLEEESLDFVDIATPPHLHSRLTIQCASRGLHVLCEKPLSLKRREFDTIERIVTAGRVAVVPVHNWRHAPLLRQAFRLVRRITFGKVRMVEWHVLRNEPARDAGESTHGWRLDPALAGGGILVDHGWHAFYLVMALIGEQPDALAAVLQGRRFREAALEDTAHCLIRFPHATASIFLTWAAEERRVRGTIIGEGATLLIDDDRLMLLRPGRPDRLWRFPESLSGGSQHPTWFAGTLAEFHLAIQEPARRVTHLREARTCLALLTAAYAKRRTDG